jgi:hypothetical protein
MHDILYSNMIFHTLSTLALLIFSAATALHDPLRRREPRLYAVATGLPKAAVPARTDHDVYQHEQTFHLDQATAA